MNCKDLIIQVIQSPRYRPQNMQQLWNTVSAMDQDAGFTEFGQALQDLEHEALLAYGKRGLVINGDAAGYISGKFCANPRGFGFVVPDEAYAERCGGDIFIPPDATMCALEGDSVRVRLVSEGDGEHGPEGRVLFIVSRAVQEVTGTLIRRGRRHRNETEQWFLCPDDRRLNFWVSLSGNTDNLRENDKARARIVVYPQPFQRSVRKMRRTSPKRVENRVVPPDILVAKGELLQVFGESESVQANCLAVLAEFGIPASFSQKVLDEADRSASRRVTSRGRLDLRDTFIMTIDGADAKDLDDAVSVTKTEDGWELCVHIADVSHYVPQGGDVDAEALERGTSVYFADRVVPMLPPSLSNGACSLNENVNRFALSALITLDREGAIVACRPVESVIRSSIRGVYSEVNDLIEKREKSIYALKYTALMRNDRLDQMTELYRLLSERSVRRGVMELDADEAHIIMQDGNPVDIVLRERGTAERMIEQFMLCANEAIATYLHEHDFPCVYRVHEVPPVEKMQSFALFAHDLGLSVAGFDPEHPSPLALSAILEQARERGIEQEVSAVLLRSLAKARYTTAPLGHFGLAAPLYCHFTSPIRRYPDLCVHRLVKAALRGGEDCDQKSRDALRAEAESIAVRSSENELRAMNAERAMDDLYKTVYMSRFTGERFEGTVSSVMSFGIFVRLPNTVEGLIPAANLPAPVEFDEARCAMSAGGRRFTLGDCVSVICARADVTTRRITWEFVGDETPTAD